MRRLPVDLTERTCTGCKLVKPISEFNFYVRWSYVRKKDKPPKPESKCKKCTNERNRAWALANPEKYKNSIARWNKANHLQEKLRVSKWAKDHLAHCNAKSKKRRLAKQNATPSWANEFFVNEIYHLAFLRTKLTGIKWEVDHEIPLKGKIVCGLHTEQNLRVVPRSVNRRKNNFFCPDKLRGPYWQI